MFHSDYSAGLGLTENQAKINASIQSGDKLPDLYIFKASRTYCGMALEIKKGGTPVIIKIGQNKGRLTSDPHIRAQAVALKKLIGEGWYGNFGVGYEECIQLIDWYFEKKQNATLF